MNFWVSSAILNGLTVKVGLICVCPPATLNGLAKLSLMFVGMYMTTSSPGCSVELQYPVMSEGYI